VDIFLRDVEPLNSVKLRRKQSSRRSTKSSLRASMKTLSVHVQNNTMYDDRPEDITLSRRIARSLSKYNWYFKEYPTYMNSTNDEIQYPKLDVAWEHFEHIALPRCFKKVGSSNNFDRAEPGEIEEPTMLYPVWKTKLVDMGDFGIGVGLYFSTLQFFAIITFLAGLINLPAVAHFTSSSYSPDGGNDHSAVCTESEWEPCPTCHASDWDRHPTMTYDRFAQTSDKSLTFIKVNDCKISDVFGISAYASLIFVIVAVYFVSWLQARKAIEFDEAQQTSSDYSIKVMNPPPTAKDHDAWKLFFETRFNADVKFSTVAIDNAELIEAVIQRRKLLITLQNMLPLGYTLKLNDYDGMVQACGAIPCWKRLLCFAKSPEQLVVNIREKEAEIVAFAKNANYKAVSVFITFNTESDQRNVLHALSVPRFKEKNLKKEHKFEGRVLKICEADEPRSIRWNNLQDSANKQAVRNLFTFVLSIVIVIGGASLIWLTSEKKNTGLTSIVIMTQSLLTPIIVTTMTTTFESHHNESSMIASQYLKITAFRWIVTVIVPLFLTPFANILDDDSLFKQISTLLVLELCLRPIGQMINAPGFIKRHILGPRKRDQRQMNLSFDGDRFIIHERYTEVTKIFFLTVFYCILDPLSFFYASAIFIVYYWVDKFCILRSWQQGPAVGYGVYNSTLFFFKLCTLLYAVSSTYFLSQFPFDNACESFDEENITAYTGDRVVTLLDGTNETIHNITAFRPYKFCNQETIRSGKFPPLPEKTQLWMDATQEKWVELFAWTSVGVTAIVAFAFLRSLLMSFIYPLFFKVYVPDGEATNEKFDDVHEIDAYIPMMKAKGFSFPFLLCDVNNIDTGYIGWSDVHAGYKRHNLVNDVSAILARLDRDLSKSSVVDLMFATVKEWSPGADYLKTLSSTSTAEDSDGPPEPVDSFKTSSIKDQTQKDAWKDNIDS